MPRCPIRHDFISVYIANVFAAYGRFLSHHPYLVLTTVSVLCVFLSAGVQHLRVVSLEMEDFTPQDSRALSDKLVMAQYENLKKVGDIPTQANQSDCRYSEVIFVGKKGVNLFSLKSFNDIRIVEDRLFNVTIDSQFDPDDVYTYGKMCSKQADGQCFGSTLRKFEGLFPIPFELFFALDVPGFGLTYPYYNGLFVAQTLAEVTTANNTINGVIKSAGVFREIYFACFPADEVKAADAWDEAFDRVLTEESMPSANHSFDMYWHSNKRSEAQIVHVALKLIPFFALTLVALAFFSMVATLWGDSVSSKPCLGFIGIVITGFAILSSFGLMAWLNQPFVTICIATPFLALAIGLDDMHVLLAGWRLTDRRLPVCQRMEETLRESGTSIFITFLTNMIGFIIGSYMPYPAIQKLSTFTTAAMCLDFGFQMTLFTSCLVLFGNWEAANRHSLCCCFHVTRPMFSVKTSITKAILCASRHISDDKGSLIWPDSKKKQPKAAKTESTIVVVDQTVIATRPATPLATLPTPSPSSANTQSGGQFGDQSPKHAEDVAGVDSSAIADFFRYYYTPALLSTAGKIFVFLLYAGYLVRVIYGINQLRIGFRAENLFPRESHSYAWYQMMHGHFHEYWPQIPVVFNGPLDYSDPKVQVELEDLFQKLESSRFIWDHEVTRFWLRDYMTYYRHRVNATIPAITTATPGLWNSSTTTPGGGTNFDYLDDTELEPIGNLSFYDMLREFLKHPKHNSWAGDIAFAPNDSQLIVMSRGWVAGFNVSTPENERDLLFSIRDLIDSFKRVPIAGFAMDFILYEQHGSIIYNCMYNILIAIAAVVIVSVVMAPYLACGFWLLFCLISIVLGLFGIMAGVGIDLDSVSMVTIIIGVGFSTDFIAHYTFGYIMAEGSTPREKAEEALRDTGSATVPTAIGTIMSVLAMASSTLYVYVVFFKMMSLTIALCAIHSLVFLPVILSMLGPMPPPRRRIMAGLQSKPNEKNSSQKKPRPQNPNKGSSQTVTTAISFVQTADGQQSDHHQKVRRKAMSAGVLSPAKPSSEMMLPNASLRAVCCNKEVQTSAIKDQQHYRTPQASMQAKFTVGDSAGDNTTGTTSAGSSGQSGQDAAEAGTSSSEQGASAIVTMSASHTRRPFIAHEFGFTAKSAADIYYESEVLRTTSADMRLDEPATPNEKVQAYLEQIKRVKPTFGI